MATAQDLTEARAALHSLIIGKKAVKVQMNGRSVEYTPASKSQLEQYINQLETELGLTQARRPARVYL